MWQMSRVSVGRVSLDSFIRFFESGKFFTLASAYNCLNMVVGFGQKYDYWSIIHTYQEGVIGAEVEVGRRCCIVSLLPSAESRTV